MSIQASHPKGCRWPEFIVGIFWCSLHNYEKQNEKNLEEGTWISS